MKNAELAKEVITGYEDSTRNLGAVGTKPESQVFLLPIKKEKATIPTDYTIGDLQQEAPLNSDGYRNK